MKKQTSIAIVGGGPGGLILARLLQGKRFSATVYERDRDAGARQQGATLDLHQDSGLRALREAGLMEAFKANYRPGADRLRITDAQATVVLDDHNEKPEADFESEHFRPEIDRGPLRELLIDSLLPGSMVWGAQFERMERSGAGWTLRFRDGSSAYADLVVGADGAASRIRPYLTDIAPVYSGVTIVEGNIYNAARNVPELNALLNGGKVFALGSEKSIILSAKGEGSLSFYTGTKEAEDWVKGAGIDFGDRRQVLDWFRGRYSDWSTVWETLFESGDSYLIPRPQYHFPQDQHWQPQANLTLLGDAAHRMPPYAGEGVNMAMLDALELYECLANPAYEDMHNAIAAYERRMLKRAAEVTEHTLQQTEALHAPGALRYLTNMFEAGPKTPGG